MQHNVPDETTDRRARFHDLQTALEAGMDFDQAKAYNSKQTDSALGGLFLDLKTEFGIMLADAVLMYSADGTGAHINITNTRVECHVYLQWLKLMAGDIKLRYAKENHTLWQDLNKLWTDNHLTNTHVLFIQEYAGASDGSDSHIPFTVLKDGNAWKASKKLLTAIRRIYDTYRFDKLECRPSCGDSQNVLFARKIDGVLCDVMTDENGVRQPTTGVLPEDCEEEEERNYDGYTGYVN
jgi:hypothetical protein